MAEIDEAGTDFWAKYLAEGLPNWPPLW